MHFILALLITSIFSISTLVASEGEYILKTPQDESPYNSSCSLNSFSSTNSSFIDDFDDLVENEDYTRISLEEIYNALLAETSDSSQENAISILNVPPDVLTLICKQLILFYEKTFKEHYKPQENEPKERYKLMFLSYLAYTLAPLVRAHTKFISPVLKTLSTYFQVPQLVIAACFSYIPSIQVWIKHCLPGQISKALENNNAIFLYENALGTNPLIEALRINRFLKNNAAIINAFLTHTPELAYLDNYKHVTPIMYAAETDNHTILEKVLFQIPSENLAECINGQDAKGRTALYRAIQKDCLKTAAYLLGLKADPDISTVDGLTPLHVAGGKGSLHAVKLLLNNKASIDVEDISQRTALIVALIRLGTKLKKPSGDKQAIHEHKEAVKELLSHSTRYLTQLNNLGESALYWAQLYNLEDITQLILATKTTGSGI